MAPTQLQQELEEPLIFEMLDGNRRRVAIECQPMDQFIEWSEVSGKEYDALP